MAKGFTFNLLDEHCQEEVIFLQLNSIKRILKEKNILR